MEQNNREASKNRRNLLIIGLITIGMFGLNYLGYKLGVNTNFLATHFAITLAIGEIFFIENIRRLIDYKKTKTKI